MLFIKKIKNLNLAKNVESTTFIMFPSKLCEEIMLKQMQMAVKALKMVNDQTTCYLAYYNNKSVLPKGWLFSLLSYKPVHGRSNSSYMS